MSTRFIQDISSNFDKNIIFPYTLHSACVLHNGFYFVFINSSVSKIYNSN